jgi:nicotinamide mononucleotide (NMN) deamidase PncC
MVLMDLPREAVAGMRSASEPYALLLARTARERFGATWGISETGAAGPTGNGYGDAPGHTCIAISGPVETAITLETGEADRDANMTAFAAAALDLLKRGVDA